MQILSSKLKNLEIYLKEWNHNVFGNLKRNIHHTKQNLVDTNKLFETHPNSNHVKMFINSRRFILPILRIKKLFGNKKSRVKLFSDGDANPMYFHAYCKN